MKSPLYWVSDDDKGRLDNRRRRIVYTLSPLGRHRALRTMVF